MKLHRYRNPANNELQNTSVEVLTYEQGNTAPSAPQLSQKTQLCSNITTVNSNIEKLYKIRCLPDILINLEKRRNIPCLSILHKILHKVDQSLHCKLPQFANPFRITRHITQQNDKTFVLTRYYTYQFSRCFTYSTIQLWKCLPNETILTVKQDCFIALAKKVLKCLKKQIT